MRIGFLTGSITRIGSGRTEAVPLAHAFSRLGCKVYGLETSRFKRRQETIENMQVHLEPIAPYLAPRFLQFVQMLFQRRSSHAHAPYRNGVRFYNLAAGDAMLSLGDRLQLDLFYAFHNTNVARVLKGWPHPSRLLVINLIGFGIDPSRGGSSDTFPLQKLIFEHPYWDLHITATLFEYEQYCQVYEQLEIDQGKLMHLPHSYDEELFCPPMPSSDGGRPDSDRASKTILYPVNVYPRKNIELAIDVLSILNREVNCRLIVSGKIWDRAYHARLLQRAQDHGVGDRVEFLRGVAVEEMVQLYRQADVTVYTSHQETFGHGIVESLGCGTPVVGPDWILPCYEILNRSLGCQAAPNDPARFATAILDLFNLALSPEQLAVFAKTYYGNTSIATRFLERCQEIKARKAGFRARLESINWKGLYRDAGDLL